MVYLLYFSAGYLILTSLILLRNRVNFTPLLPATGSRFTDQAPKVSICVPARNEEANIEHCLLTLLKQDYPNYDVFALNDRSEDSTSAILTSLSRQFPDQLNIIEGQPKPDDWLGKPWACHQLAKSAAGDILIFVDADTRLEPDTASRVVRSMGHHVIDFLTVWPRQELGSFWENMIIPLVYYALLSLLPSYYVYRAPRWMPKFLRKKYAHWFAAACGQFMAFKKTAYRAIGGHEAVKNKIVEDVELARLVKKAGYKMRMYYGALSVSCRMYHSRGEIREGFRKNFLPGYHNNIPLFISAAFVHIVVYLLPYVTLVAGVYYRNFDLILWSLIPVAFISIHRFLLASRFEWNPWYIFLHPISVLWFQLLGYRVLKDYFSGERVEWKGRSL